MSSNPDTFQHRLVDVHGNYRSGRSSHEPPDELISDVVSARTLRPHIVRWLFFFGASVVVGLFWLLFYVVSQATRITSIFSDSSGTSASDVLSTLTGIVFVGLLIVWAVCMFLPLREPIAEYGLLVENRAGVYPFVYSWITETVLNRQSPFELGFGKVRGVPALTVVNGRVRGMISVRPVGTDLFLGWHMWRNRSTVVVVGHLFRDMFQRGQAWAPVEVVRAGWSAAMRELLHSVTREGAQAAMLDAMPVGFAPKVVVENLDELDRAGAAPAAPRYGGPPPAAPPSAPPAPPPAPPAPPTAPTQPSGPFAPGAPSASAGGSGQWWSASGGTGTRPS